MSARDWETANQEYLLAALEEVRDALERHAAAVSGDRDHDRDWDDAHPSKHGRKHPVHHPAKHPPRHPAWRHERPPALEAVREAFGLSPFERAVLLLCAGVELAGDFPALCARAHGDPQRTHATLALAVAALPGAHWSALSPEAPLRRWRLVEVGPGTALTQSPLRADERVLHYLAGVGHSDERLSGLVSPAPPLREMSPSQWALARRVAATWSRAAADAGGLPAIQLIGRDPAARRDVASAACSLLGLGLGITPAGALPTAPAELEQLARVWEREAALEPAALLLDRGEHDAPEPAREAVMELVLERLRGPLLLAGREPRGAPHRPGVTVEVEPPTLPEQRESWRDALGDDAPAQEARIEAIVSQFRLGPQAVRAACAAALGRVDAESGEEEEDEDDRLADDDDDASSDDRDRSSEDRDRERRLGEALWDACRVQARARLDDLAQRIESRAGWDDLVLPAHQRRMLQDLAAQVRHRSQVYERWGFASRSKRGLGIAALFAGESGTGKTLAAEVVARELRLDLFRVDLAGLISKYIGETEKNLRRVFDAAEEGGAVLLFDEADAVFGKRSEVKDSHDRHANVEVSYLLQRMEAYPGLAVLTTNLKDALDTAFLRRIRFIVNFPFPDAAQRAEIWRRVFPRQTPTQGLKYEELAKLNVSGGNIRNIALNAAFYAADEGSPVRMPHLLRAARAEYEKLERPLTAGEVSGWT